MNKKKIKIFALIALLVAVPAGIAYWLYSSHYESTDDAFLESDVVMMSSRVRGNVQAVHIEDNQLVKEGDLLVEIDPGDYQAALASAQADLAMAQSEADKAQGDLNRSWPLAQHDEVPRQQIAHLQAETKAAQARVQAAQAKVNQAQLNLSYTKITAPWTGRVTKKSVQVGANVDSGQLLFALVSQNLWVVANFKETQIGRMQPGQRASIAVDAIGKTFGGHVESLQAGSGARFSLFPPENATGNFVKVVQRLPVKIVFDQASDEVARLGPGLSVRVKVRVK